MSDKKPDNMWDEIVRDQAAMRQLAQKAKMLWKTLDRLPQEELVRIFIAICKSGEEFDPQMSYRNKILGLIHDEYLPELVGLRVPVILSWKIEKRLWIVPKETPDSPFIGDVDLSEISD